MAEVKITVSEDYVSSGAFNKIEQNAKTAVGKVSSVFESIKSNWMAVGGAIGAAVAIWKGIEHVTDVTRELSKQTSKLQRMTGETAESASTFIAVADQVGIKFDTIETAVVAVTRRMGGLKDMESAVTDETGKSTDVFEKFGIEVKNQDGSLKKFTDVFSQIRTRIQAAGSATEQLAIATQFFRGSAVDMLKILKMTDAEYKQIADDAKKYGVILTQDNVNAVKQYTMAQRDMDDALNGIKLTVGNLVIPVLTLLTTTITDIIGAAREMAADVKSGWLIVMDAMGQKATETARKVDEQAKAHKAAAESAEDQAKKVAATVKALDAYAGIVEKLGEGKLKLAESKFSEQLKTEEEGITSIKGALTTYLGELQSVFAARYSGEVKIAELMRKTNDPQKIAEQNAKVIAVEQQSALARYTAWNQYYSALEQRYNQNIQAMLATQAKVEGLQQMIYDQNMSYFDMMNTLRQTDMSATERYYDQQAVLEQKFQAALMLDGEARVKALQNYQQAVMATVGQVTEGDQVVITSSQSVATAMDKIGAAQNAIADTTDKMQDELQSTLAVQLDGATKLALEMDKTKGSIEAVRMEMLELGRQFDEQKVLTVNTAGALAGISEVKALIDQIPPVIYREVVVKFFTQASPIMGFTEGMGRIQQMLTSLPSGSEFTVKFGQLAADWQKQTTRAETMQGYQKTFDSGMSLEGQRQAAAAQGNSNQLWGQMQNIYNAVVAQKNSGAGMTMNYSPTINVGAGAGGDGRTLAKQIDTQLADDVRFDRSQLFVAVKNRLGVPTK